MPTDKQLYNLYLREMKRTGVAVNKKLLTLVDSFAKRVLKEPNTPIEKIYLQEVKRLNIVDDVAEEIQSGMIRQTAIGYGILPTVSASTIAPTSTVDLQEIFGKTNGKKLSRSVYKSVENSQKTVYNTIVESSKLNKTWKETSKELTKAIKGDLKGYQNIPNHIKELESVGRKALTGTDKRQFINRLKKSREEVEKLSDNRVLKKSYRAALNRLERAVKKNDAVLFEKAIKGATYAKNQSLAERTIITEQSRVFEQSRYNERIENPLITAIKFNLSSDHDFVDQCDVIAEADNGLGEGVYSLDNQPAMPIHPNGVSFLTDVTIDKVSQKQADRFKYNHSKMKRLGEQKELSPSQTQTLKEMEFMKKQRIDKQELENIVTK